MLLFNYLGTLRKFYKLTLDIIDAERNCISYKHDMTNAISDKQELQ